MEEFIDYSKVIMGTLGYKLFEPVINKSCIEKQDAQEIVETDQIPLYLERVIKNVGKVNANGIQTSEGFVVFSGSRISPQDDNTIPAVIKERRKSAPIDINGILKEDLLFTSPSYAAMFVIGKSANGLTSWKTQDGKTLKSLENEEV